MLAEQESVDVKALRARFNNKHNTSDTSSRDSGSPKSPRPGFGRAILPVPGDEIANRLSPTPPVLSAGPVPLRLPKADHTKSASSSAVRASVQPGDLSKVRQTGELLQNIMLRQQRTSGTKPGLALAIAPSPTSTPPLPQQPRQRSAGDVIPLKRPLPPEGPRPLKPKRPPRVNLDPFLRFRQGSGLGAIRNSVAASSGPADRRASLPAVLSPPKLPQRLNKPKTLPHQIASVDFEDEQDPYDDIASFEKSGSCSDNSSQCLDRDERDDVYEFIDDEDLVGVNHVAVVKKNKEEVKRQLEQEKKEKTELRKKQNELRKNFQFQGEVQVLHTARVRQDWHGGSKLDLSVQQGESVEILRVENNPGGKWLARSLTGHYGYISNACVDIDYEAIKRYNLLPSKRMDAYPLPPPPPDPPKQFKLESNRNSSIVDDDNYDDVQPIPEDFPLPPPPPPEICTDPKLEKELRKKFKYEGPITVLHTMMVDPNCVIKKPGGKDLHVTRGEVVDVIQLTNDKKVLCRNSLGKYGYVFRYYLLTMEGDIYDDVDYTVDVYDNDAPY